MMPLETISAGMEALAITGLIGGFIIRRRGRVVMGLIIGSLAYVLVGLGMEGMASVERQRQARDAAQGLKAADTLIADASKFMKEGASIQADVSRGGAPISPADAARLAAVRVEAQKLLGEGQEGRADSLAAASRATALQFQDYMAALGVIFGGVNLALSLTKPRLLMTTRERQALAQGGAS